MVVAAMTMKPCHHDYFERTCMHCNAQRIEKLEAALAAFEDWASPMTEGDYGRGLPDILSQARKALEDG